MRDHLEKILFEEDYAVTGIHHGMNACLYHQCADIYRYVHRKLCTHTDAVTSVASFVFD